MAKQDNNLTKAKDIIDHNRYQLIGLAAFLTIGVGTVFYHYVEEFSWLDSLYFCVITLTTIGYGDIAPKTPLGKLFTIFYVLVGVGIIVTFTSTLIDRAHQRRLKRRE